MTRRLFRRASCSRGQSMVEFAMVLPLVTMLVLGVVELGYALLDAHVVTKMTREGSNLISRDTSIDDAVNAMKNMSNRPINFDDGSSTLIFSVVKRIGTAGANNLDKNILFERRVVGTYPGQSALTTAGTATFGGSPDYVAADPDNDTRLQITNFPPNLLVTRGALIYVTEIFTKHTLLTPLDQFGIPVPSTLYSIAYF